MSTRNISQIAKKLLRAQISIAEAEQIFGPVRITDSEAFTKIDARVGGAMKRLVNDKKIIEEICDELLEAVS